MKISADYPGGNIRVHEIIENDPQFGCTVVKLEQDLRDTPVWWFYWNFRVDCPKAEKVVFSFQNRGVVSSHGAATSTDGLNWHFCEKNGFIDHQTFTYEFEEGEKSRYFAFSLPYQLQHFENFFETIQNDPAVQRSVFTMSEQGRELPLLTFGEGKKDIVFTARHHCCESPASYVLEGVISALLSDFRKLLSQYRFHVIPFTDLDGAENGDQGKDRTPHDHNRDYTDAPIYRCTQRMMEYTESLHPEAYLDFHSPWCWGGRDDAPHIHLGPAENRHQMQDFFVDTLVYVSAENADPETIVYDGCVTRYGEDNANKVNTPNAKNFFAQKRNCRMSFSLETPYSGNLLKPYTVNALRIWGGHIAKALFLTLEQYR